MKTLKVLNCLQKTRFSRLSLRAFRRSAEKLPKPPRSTPRTPKATQEAKSGPGEPQERGPGAARSHPKIVLSPLWSPEVAQRPPGSDVGAAGASSGRFLKAFWEPPGPHFQAFPVLFKDVAPAAIVSFTCWVGGFPRKRLQLKPYFRQVWVCLLYTSPSPRDGLLSRMPSSA